MVNADSKGGEAAAVAGPCGGVCRFAACVGVVAAACLLLLPERSLGGWVAGLGDLRDALHLPLFVLLAAGMALLAGAGRRDGSRRWIVVCVGVLVLAVASELLQSRVGRSASWGDLMIDLAGGVAGLLGWWGLLQRRWWLLGGVFMLAAALFLFLARGVWLAPAALRAQEASYPQVIPAGALSAWLLESKAGTRVEWKGEQQGVSISWQAGDWRGVEIRLAGGEAWQEATGLEVVIDNHGERFVLGLRVDGEGGQRATGALDVAPGLNRLRMERSKLRGNDAAWNSPLLLHLHGGAGSAARDFRLSIIELVK